MDYDNFVPRNLEGCFFSLVLTHCEHLADVHGIHDVLPAKELNDHGLNWLIWLAMEMLPFYCLTRISLWDCSSSSWHMLCDHGKP